MLVDGETWFLLADGRRARLYVQPRRGATLQAPDDWKLEISDEETYDIQDRPPRSFDRVGAGRHAMDGGRNLHEQEEVKFLKRVADRIVEAEKQKAFRHLVVAAPPRALGILRESLPASVQAYVRAEAPKDLIDESAEQLRTRLEELLRNAG
ncbi:MAG: host attachment protein [Hyphomonadaceae bacterium]